MLVRILAACALVVATVLVHAFGFRLLLFAILRTRALSASSFWSVQRVVVGLTFFLLLIHLAEIAIWAAFYSWQGCLPDVESAFYFSGVTYTTVGYGDLVLPKEWRLLAPVEATTGILMFGLSTGLFFALVNQYIDRILSKRDEDAPRRGAQGRE